MQSRGGANKILCARPGTLSDLDTRCSKLGCPNACVMWDLLSPGRQRATPLDCNHPASHKIVLMLQRMGYCQLWSSTRRSRTVWWALAVYLAGSTSCVVCRQLLTAAQPLPSSTSPTHWTFRHPLTSVQC
jgi:hypothetical protein